MQAILVFIKEEKEPETVASWCRVLIGAPLFV